MLIIVYASEFTASEKGREAVAKRTTQKEEDESKPPVVVVPKAEPVKDTTSESVVTNIKAAFDAQNLIRTNPSKVAKIILQ